MVTPDYWTGLPSGCLPTRGHPCAVTNANGAAKLFDGSMTLAPDKSDFNALRPDNPRDFDAAGWVLVIFGFVSVIEALWRYRDDWRAGD